MRFLLYLNTIAIILLAGALARLYDGAPLPWADGPIALAVDLAPPQTSPLTTEQYAALQLPLPHPTRAPVAVSVPEVEKLRLLTEGDYRPFNYRDGRGELTGFDIEIALALCARLKAECIFELRPWSELLPALKRGEGDAVVASMLIPVPGREAPVADDEIIFTERYYSTPGHFASRRSNVPVAATPAALAGKQIAVQAGSVHHAYIRTRFPEAAPLALPTLAEAQDALAAGRADLLFADRNVLSRWTASGSGAACCRLVGSGYADPAWFGEGAGIALRVDDKVLRDRINAALEELVADGTYARINARYFANNIY
ncbi:MAG: transporter substrate-binding domain-containing protein [Parvibaculum sp.]|uniref:transporter substrate-binding domain-containing protein n=1 Tax=Parvibaculum sp. TaxID=2024848 RepID=UPI0034A03559